MATPPNTTTTSIATTTQSTAEAQQVAVSYEVTNSPEGAAKALFTGSISESDSKNVPNFTELNKNPLVALNGRMSAAEVAAAADADRENFLGELPNKILAYNQERLDKGVVIDLAGLENPAGIIELVGKNDALSHTRTLLQVEKQLHEAGLVPSERPSKGSLSLIVENIDIADGKIDGKLSIPEVRNRMIEAQVFALQEVEELISNLQGTTAAKDRTAKVKE